MVTFASLTYPSETFTVVTPTEEEDEEEELLSELLLIAEEELPSELLLTELVTELDEDEVLSSLLLEELPQPVIVNEAANREAAITLMNCFLFAINILFEDL